MKFIVTRELGKLAKWLRIFGYDTEYFTRPGHSSLIIQALRDERIILTRNHRLPKSAGIKIVLLENEKIKAQIREVLKELKISPNCDMMFSRCIICNLELENTDKEKIKDKIPEYVFNTQDNFRTCPACQRIYWLGTHWGNVQTTLNEIGL
jgi:uncharacterized protein with PIN domain